jgi:hypothetical protein
MRSPKLVIQASSVPLHGSSLLENESEIDNIPINFKDAIIMNEFQTVSIDSDHMCTSTEPGRLFIFSECNFMNAVGNMTQTTPEMVGIAFCCSYTFNLDPMELAFLRICHKHKLHMQKYMIKKTIFVEN